MKLHLNQKWIAAAAGAVAMTLASASFGQYRIDTGHALDANNRIGSGSLNSDTSGNASLYQNPYNGVTGNDIVTGNVTGGKAFQGFVPYTDPRAFRGILPERATDLFVRDSSGTPYAGYGGFNSNANTVRPYYGDSQGTPPPAGFTQINIGSPGYVPAPPVARQGADLRLGNPLSTTDSVTLPQPGETLLPGPVDPSTNNNTLITASSLYGVRQLNPANSSDQQFVARFANAFNDNFDNTTLSDLDVQAMRRDLQQQAASQGRAMTFGGAITPQQIANPNLAEQNAAQKPLQPGTPNAPLSQPLGKPFDAPDNSSLNSGSVDASLPSGPLSSSLNTQQSIAATFNVPPAQQSAANAELEKRLEQEFGKKPETPEESSTQFNKALQAQKDKAAGQGKAPVAPKQGANGQPAQPGVSDEATPAVPGPTEGSGTKTAPLQIKSFATGVKSKGLGDILKTAEDQMKQGKWYSAVQQYDMAEQVAPNNMLIFIGRANAELGGSYYGQAEADLRHAFTTDNATLTGQYDLHNMIGDERLEFLVKDLKEINAKNPNQSRPLFLLAYISYNTGNERLAAGYLDLAEKHAGPNDTFYSTVRHYWNLPATGQGQTPELNK